MSITIEVEDLSIIIWPTFQAWVNNAARDFRRLRAGGDLPHEGGFVCVDAGGFVCETGGDLMAARDAGRFPVSVFKFKKAGAS